MPKKLFVDLTRQAQNKRIRKFLAKQSVVNGIAPSSSKPFNYGFEENLSDHFPIPTITSCSQKKNELTPDPDVYELLDRPTIPDESDEENSDDEDISINVICGKEHQNRKITEAFKNWNVKYNIYAVCMLRQEGNALINVCRRWLVDNNTYTFYPPMSANIRGLLKKNVEADYSTWTKYPVRVLKFYDSFEKAEARTRKACDRSNLKTSDEEDNRRSINFRRKRDISQGLEFLDGVEAKKKQLAGTSRSESPPYPSFPEINRPADVCINTLQSTPTPVTTNPFLTPTMSHTSSPSSPSLSNTPEFLAIQRSLTQILTVMSDISQNMKELTKKNEDPMREITQRDEGITDKDEGSVRQFECLPLQEMVEFEKFEKNLSDGMKKQLIKVIRSVGGNDPGQTVNLMLRRIMADELAMKFSFTGKVMAGKGKKAFGSTEVSKCIIVALRGLYGPDITDSKFSMLAGKWFQQARTRVERRKPHTTEGTAVVIIKDEIQE